MIIMFSLFLQAATPDLICRPAISGHPSANAQVEVAGMPVAADQGKSGAVDFVTDETAPADRCAGQTGKRPYNIIGIPRPPARPII